MSDETQLLTALFTASTGLRDEARAEFRSHEAPAPKAWTHFLRVLANVTHADSAQLHLIENNRSVQSWQVGDDLGDADMIASDRMRTSRVYSQFDHPSALKSNLPLRAIRWRVATGAWGVITLKRRSEDFRAIDGQHLSNLLPYLAPTVRAWQSLTRERTQADLAHQISADLGAGWIILTPTGQVTAMASGLTAQLEAVAGIGLSGENRLRLTPVAARALRDALGAIANGNPGPHSLWLTSSPRVQMILTPQHHAGTEAMVGRIRYNMMASALPLSQIMTAFDLSRSEARLAAALCDGLSLSDAAQTLAWTIETTRSTSKQLFAHMGVRGQPGVVRAMHASAIWL
jgi:hypothetical protein